MSIVDFILGRKAKHWTHLESRIKNLDKEVFFILSTARCRSSWFGNFFTYKDSFCYNEELRYIIDWDELIDKIEQRPEKYVGFEDPELLHHIETLYRLFPNATYVLLERERMQSQISLERVSGLSSDLISKKFERWYNDIDKFKKIVAEYATIHFNKMDIVDEVKRIWEYVLPGVHFDIQRWEMLTALQIRVTMSNKPYIIRESCMAPYFDFEKLEKIR